MLKQPFHSSMNWMETHLLMDLEMYFDVGALLSDRSGCNGCLSLLLTLKPQKHSHTVGIKFSCLFYNMTVHKVIKLGVLLNDCCLTCWVSDIQWLTQCLLRRSIRSQMTSDQRKREPECLKGALDAQTSDISVCFHRRYWHTGQMSSLCSSSCPVPDYPKYKKHFQIIIFDYSCSV